MRPTYALLLCLASFVGPLAACASDVALPSILANVSLGTLQGDVGRVSHDPQHTALDRRGNSLSGTPDHSLFANRSPAVAPASPWVQSTGPPRSAVLPSAARADPMPLFDVGELQLSVLASFPGDGAPVTVAVGRSVWRSVTVRARKST